VTWPVDGVRTDEQHPACTPECLRQFVGRLVEVSHTHLGPEFGDFRGVTCCGDDWDSVAD
jgi:hypothetical protein